MLGVLHIRSINDCEDSLIEFLGGVNTNVRQSMISELRKHDRMEQQGIELPDSFVDKGGFQTPNECFAFVSSKGPSVILGRGGPSPSVKSYLCNIRSIPRASCMLSLASWEEENSPFQCSDIDMPARKISHHFALHCLRGKIFVSRNEDINRVKSDSIGDGISQCPAPTVDMRFAQKVNLVHKNVSCVAPKNNVFSSKQSLSIPGTQKKNAQTHMSEFVNACTMAAQDTLTHNNDSPHADAIETLHPNDSMYLTNGDSFELKNSGIIVTCYAFPEDECFQSLLPMSRLHLTSSVLEYRDLFAAHCATTIDTIDECINLTSFKQCSEKDQFIPFSAESNTARNIFTSKETSGDDASSQRVLSNESISNTQCMDIVGHLESLVEEEPNTQNIVSSSWRGNGAKPNSGLSGRPSMSRKDLFSILERNNILRYEESPSSALPVESQVVYYEHQEG